MLPPGRMLRLAASASKGASLSARAELYPKGMAPVVALRLSLGSLAGPTVLREKEVRDRVSGRFPDAVPLPPRPELDHLLDEVGAERIWRDDHPEGSGYVSRIGRGTIGYARSAGRPVARGKDRRRCSHRSLPCINGRSSARAARRSRVAAQVCAERAGQPGGVAVARDARRS